MNDHKSRHSWAYWSIPILYLTMMILAWHYHPQVGRPGIILNHGIAFGLLSHTPSGILILYTLGVMVIMTFFLVRWPFLRLPLSWLVTAAAANWTDRIIWGGVVDYWQIRPYPYIFNLADVILRLSSLLLIIEALRHSQKQDSTSRKSAASSRSLKP